VQVPVQEALPASQPAGGDGGIDLPCLDSVRELVQVKEALMPPVDGNQDVEVAGSLRFRSAPALGRQAGSDILTPRWSSTNTRSRRVRPGQGVRRLDNSNS
jgi:hypothetical protein